MARLIFKALDLLLEFLARHTNGVVLLRAEIVLVLADGKEVTFTKSYAVLR